MFASILKAAISNSWLFFWVLKKGGDGEWLLDFHSLRRFFLFSPNPALIHSKLKELFDKLPRSIKIPKIHNN